MNMFQMTGNRVELYRYTTTYTENDTEITEGIISDEHKAEMEKMLTDRNITFTTTAVDQTKNEWFDGLEFDSYDDAVIAFNQGIVYANAKKIEILKAELADTDYQIIKCYEYQLVGLDSPYDILTLHTSRDAIRKQIDVLQSTII